MRSCTFFGHRDAPEEISEFLEQVIIELIEKKGVCRFYIGNHGTFDQMAIGVLERLQKKYRFISYFVVLAYYSHKKNENYKYPTIYPEGLENFPKKYAILARNLWMIERSEYVVTYVKYIGGAEKHKKLAQKKGKIIVELAK